METGTFRNEHEIPKVKSGQSNYSFPFFEKTFLIGGPGRCHMQILESYAAQAFLRQDNLDDLIG